MNIQLKNKRIHTFLDAVTSYWNDQNLGNLECKGPGFRVWTRGDGTRMRDPALLTADNPNTVNAVWDDLVKSKGAKPIGSVSGEFASDSFDTAISFNGFVLVKRNRAIEVMSRSRITNPNSVWQFKALNN